jgi:hypothetical protein
LLAGRYHYNFGNGVGLTAYGDLGGFGVGAHTIGRRWARSTTRSTRGSTFTWVIAASTLTTRQATAIWASTSI